MSTDELRTRAREAAGDYTFGMVDPVAQRADCTAFVDGFLTHAAQQPTREDIARAIAESQNPGVPGAFDAQRGAWLTDADAVLALFNGGDR